MKNNQDRTLLSISNLKAWYSKEKLVLNDFSLNLYNNECVGLIGLNGAGKTTFIKVVAGLLTSYECDNKVWIGGNTGFRSESFKKERYVSFADESGFLYLTFNEYLDYVFDSYEKAREDIAHLIEGFNFENYTNVLIKELSTGNKKKVSLITAFALKPKLLLLDEPVNGLDFESTEFLYKLMNEYSGFGTILFSSHILESICLISDRVLLLKDGRIERTFDDLEINADSIREALNDV